MKKTLTMALSLVMILSLALPAYAYDGNTAPRSWNSWLGWWSSFTPGVEEDTSDPTTPNKPGPAKLGVPAITESRFYHTGAIPSLKNRLQINWNSVPEAENYEIEVVKADGSVEIYSASTNSLMVKNTTCPKTYVEATCTWTAATVRVRAIAGNAVGAWSTEVKVGCDKIH